MTAPRTASSACVAVAVAALVSCRPPASPVATAPLERLTTLGAVRGVAQAASETYAWLGIPYAKPPIGELRWRAPQVSEPWPSTRAADRFGPGCAQLGGFQGPASTREYGQPVGSEDCLTLNVWRPASAARLPVVVFIHGGANSAGYTGDPLYDGAALAQRTRAVVVSLNYRLGVFGWFLHPSLRTGEDVLGDSGNLGLLDIIQALRFVQDNIAAFGGLADNVTVMGQSAGAVNAFSLMVSPLADGLFTKVIALSGALQSKPRAARDDYAERVFAALLEQTGARAEPGAAWQRAFLRRQDTASLLRAAAGIAGAGWGTADGAVLPLDGAAAVAAGRLRNVPLLVGVTRDEGTFFIPDVFAVSEAARVAAMDAFDPDRPTQLGLAELLKPAYQSTEAFHARAAEMTAVLHDLILGTLQQVGPRLDRVYAMQFDWADQVEPWRTLLGASHAMELPFVFHNFGRNYFSCAFGRANAAGREALSRRMTDALAAFLRTGDPSTPATPWPRWRREAPAMLHWRAQPAE